MDYDFLRQEGIRYIELLGSKQWTDYNSHDPGITILEQLCYALTDLLYRIDYAIPDLLAEGGNDPFASLFNPSQILTSDPVTLQDLRKLVVDTPGVRNAWIEKVGNTGPDIFFHQEENTLSLSQEDQLEPVALQGLYQIWLDAERDYQGNLSAQVAEHLHEHRSLGEDFGVERLSEKTIRLNARIEVDPAENSEPLQRAIYEQIDNYFSPPVRFYSLQERLDTGKTIDEIFEGPYLQQGFIDSLELQETGRRTELRISDLIHVLMDIKGVRAVQNLEFADGEKWLLKLDSSTTPRLDRNAPGITLVQGNIQTTISPPAYDQTTRAAPPGSGELQLPPSRDRHIGDGYYSIQHQFPDVYGVNSNGLSASASPLRRAQMKQLKAYLLLFDQLLANHFAQLANVRRLFSFAEADADAPSYFSQLLDDPALGLDENATNTLGLWTAPDKNTRRSHLEKLNSGADGDSDNQARKNRFLDHLLARFAEQFSAYTSLTQGSPAQQIKHKQTYLRQYAQLGQTRNTAPNYRQPAGPGERTGLEQRIRLKLGIADAAEIYLVEHILLRPVKDDQNQRTAILRDVQRGDPYSLQISLILPASLQPLKALICEEIPAHLSVYFPQLDTAELASFKPAYQAWRQAMSDPTTNQQTLRSTRDRLIDLLGFGRIYPLSDLAVSNEMVAYGEKAHIRIAFSQPDVSYQLCDEDGALLDGFAVSGNGSEALLETPPVTEDVTYRILACKQLDGNGCANNPYKVYLQQPAVIKVGLDTHLEAEIVRETDALGNNPAPAALLEPDATPASPAAARIIYFAHRVEIEIRNSQEGVRYKLFPTQDSSQPALSEEVTGEGSGRSIVIQSHSLAEDTDIHIQAAKTLQVSGNTSEQTDWLDTVLPLKVRANTELAAHVTPTSILAPGSPSGISLEATQTSARYRAFHHAPGDDEFVFDAGQDVLKTPVPGYPDVQVKNPAWQAIWKNTPAGYAETGAGVQGGGGQLNLSLDSVNEDSLIILQAEKQHQAGRRTIPSAVQLRQAVIFLVEPNPQPALTLRIRIMAGAARSIQVANGQTGVFYHFRLTADGEEISLPAYFHQWATDNAPENKGIGQLRIEGNFVVTSTESPQAPVVDLAAPLPANATLHIRARKARTNVTIDLTNTVPLPVIPAIQAPQTVAANSAAVIQVQSQTGDRYQLWLGEQMVTPELAGNGGTLELSTGSITADSQFTVRSIHAAAGGMSVEFDQDVLIKIQQ
jgi:hypothetical protein